MKKWFKGLDPLWQVIIVLVILLLVWLAIHVITAQLKAKKAQQIKENSVKTGPSDVSGQPVTIDLGTKAVAIYSAFHKNDWFGLSEDEDAAITELVAVPTKLIPDLSAVYFQLYGKNLKEEFKQYLSTEQWQQVEKKFS